MNNEIEEIEEIENEPIFPLFKNGFFNDEQPPKNYNYYLGCTLNGRSTSQLSTEKFIVSQMRTVKC